MKQVSSLMVMMMMMMMMMKTTTTMMICLQTAVSVSWFKCRHITDKNWLSSNRYEYHVFGGLTNLIPFNFPSSTASTEVVVFWSVTPWGFHTEDGGSMVLRNVGILPQYYRVSEPEDLRSCFTESSYYRVIQNWYKMLRTFRRNFLSPSRSTLEK